MAKNKDKEEEEKSKYNLLTEVLRVVPTQHKVEKNHRSDRLTDLLAIIFIFGIAMFIRFYVRAVFINAYGDTAFYFKINSNDTLNIGSYTGTPVGDDLYVEGYNDYYYYYIDYVNAFSEGWNPYSGSRVDGDHLGGYVYGPFYIYLISLGKLFFDLSPENSIIYSNLISDSLSYVMVYLIAKKVSGNVIAMIVATLGSFSPIALYYANIRLLNAPQMTFFALLSLYFFLERRDEWALFMLALATLTKQFPLFMALPMGLWMWRRYGFAKGTAQIILYVLFVFLMSIPYIVMTPDRYIAKMFLPGGSKAAITCPQGGEAANLLHGFISDICGSDTGALDPSLVTPTISIIDFLVNSHILFYGSIFLISWMAFTAYDYMEADNKLYLRFFGMFYFIVHATIARGIYKYYLTMLIPFMLLALVPGKTDKSLHIRLGASINRGFSTWLEPKNRIKNFNIQYWLGIIWLLLMVAGVFWLIDVAVSMFTTTSSYHFMWLAILYPVAVFSMLRPGPKDMSNEKLTDDQQDIAIKQALLLPVIVASGIYLLKVMRIYFDGNNPRLNMYTTIMIILVLLFLLFPYFQNYVFRSNKQHNLFNGDPKQFLLDLLNLVILFLLVNSFNIEILRVTRLLTTTVVLIYSIILMGLMGIECWSSMYNTPKNAWKRYTELRNIVN